MQSLPSLSRDARNADQLTLLLGSVEKDLADLQTVPVDGSVLKATGAAKFLSKLQSDALVTSSIVRRCQEIIAEWKSQIKEDYHQATLKAMQGGCLVPMPQHMACPEHIPRAMWEAFERDYNVSQLCAIEYVCRPLPSTQGTRVSLVQGPPGTGKTKTIVGMIAAFLERLKKPSSNDGTNLTFSPYRILLCAASNAAVDELVLRLLNGVRDANGFLLNIEVLRLGQVCEDTDPRVVEASLECKIEELVKVDPKHAELTRVKSQSEELKLQLDGGSDNPEHLRYQLSTLRKTRSHLEALIDRMKLDKYKEILNKSDVVVSTLSSSGQQQVLENVLACRIQFKVVIVDEAAQTTEPSVLIPLRYGCDQLVLVGDPRQLPPTVLSEDASRLGLSMSLFERLERAGHEVLMLTVQYRMHPEIRRFPSQYFYHDKLVDGEGFKHLQLEGRYRALRPVTFLDTVLGTEEKHGTSFVNDTEAQLTVRIVAALLEFVSRKEVAVITPYKAQVNRIRALLQREAPPVKVEVNR